MAEQHPPRLVISVYRLRDLRTGAEAVNQLRKRWPLLPALLITGDSAPDRLQAASHHCIPLLHKPVPPPGELYRQIIETPQSMEAFIRQTAQPTSARPGACIAPRKSRGNWSI